MKNREKYKDELLDLFLTGREIGVRSLDHAPCDCEKMECNDCILHDKIHGCKSLSDWSEEEYEPYVDWSEVAVDTPIYVSDSPEGEILRRHFARFENEKVYAFDSGKTSWSTCCTKGWKIARLAEEGER